MAEKDMDVRLLDWRDLPGLHSQKDNSIFLDTALVLTRGPLLIPGALLSYLAPSMGVITCVADGRKAGEPSIIGQFIHLSGSPFAHLTFLTPDAALDSPVVLELLDYMVALAGERGALRLLADVDERSEAFEAMRRNSFAIFSRQRVWRLTGQYSGKSGATSWRSATSRDSIPIRSLYNNVVPGLVQQVEPFVSQPPRGLVYYQDGELVAYVELKYGHRGIWAQPFVHPDAEGVTPYFIELMYRIPSRYSRPVYVCVRSYQSWLETAIEELGAEVGPRQAVMVKHLSSPQKVMRNLAYPALEGSQPEVTAPIAQTETSYFDNGTT
jgi:hypothetical protein